MTDIEKRNATNAICREYDGLKNARLVPEANKILAEIECREMIDSILTYSSTAKWDANYILNDKDDKNCLSKYIEGDKYGSPALGVERVAELINEQIADIDHIEQCPETRDGLIYSTIIWKERLNENS